MRRKPMPIMFADSIDGGILMILICGGGLVAALLALLGLFPASEGNKAATLFLIAPAFFAGVLLTGWMGFGYLRDGRHDPETDFAHDFLMPWIFLAGAPIFTCLLGISVLWMKRRKSKQQL